MTRFAQIDLSQLPPPDVIDTLDYDVVLSDAIGQMGALLPEVQEALALESEPLRKLLELISYLIVLLRARINDAARATMLATATASDLDNLAALFGVRRLLITPATENTTAVYEVDDALRARVQLAIEAYTTAGSVGSYEYHARTADPRVVDVGVTSPEPGTVLVTVLGREDAGVPPADLLAAVHGALNAEDVRPLCDTVIVSAPEIVEYSVSAEIITGRGPDSHAVRVAAQSAVEAYVAATHRLGATVALSGLLAALHQPTVIRVAMSHPVVDIMCSPTQVPWCTGITLTVGGEP